MDEQGLSLLDAGRPILNDEFAKYGFSLFLHAAFANRPT